MSFPWDKEEGFEDGTNGIFDGTEVDTAARLAIRSYRDLVALGWVAPFRGAYCAGIDLNSTSDAYLLDPDGNISADGETFYDFWFFVSANVADDMADNDQFSIFQLIATATVEGVIAIQFTTANGLRIGIGETAATAFASLIPGVWHHVCLGVVLDDGVGNDGSLELFLDDTSVAIVATLDQGAITDIRLGVVGQDTALPGQFILFDEFREDSARLRPYKERFPEQLLLTKSGHAFVGPGVIDNVSLLSGAGTDCVLTVFDTDRADVNDPSNIVLELKNTVNNELIDPAGAPARVQRGAYIQLSGTNPRALLKFGRVAAYSPGAIMRYGARVI